MARSPSDDRPWMTALEMQFAALRQAEAFRSRMDTAVAHGGARTVPGRDYREPVNRILRTLRHADAFAWSGDSVEAVSLASATIPGTVRWPALTLPAPVGWWWFGAHPLDEAVVAITYDLEPDGLLLLTAFTLRQSVPEGFTTLAWPPDEPLEAMIVREAKEPRSYAGIDAAGQIITQTPTDFPDFGYVGRFVAAGCLWLQQRIVTTASGPVERHRRKQLAREHDAPLPSDVKVIELRRTESAPHDATTAGDPVEWSCRWIVNGHWRNQPYSDGRRLIYISPFVKGPIDKPLRVPTHTVYQVDR